MNTKDVLNKVTSNISSVTKASVQGFARLSDQTLTNIVEDAKGYTLEIEVPGYTKGDLSVSYLDDRLTVIAKHDAPELAEDAKYILNERGANMEISRSYTLPHVDYQAISAKCTNGVLVITAPFTADYLTERKGTDVTVK